MMYLLIFSLIFYAWGEPKFILLMLLVSLLNYISGLIIDKNDGSLKSGPAII